MLLTAEKTRRLIGGLTIAAFFLGLILGYNNIWNFLFECTRGSKERQKKHVNLFCNLDFKGIKGNCEGSFEYYLSCFFYYGCKNSKRGLLFDKSVGGLFCNLKKRKSYKISLLKVLFDYFRNP